MSRSSVNMCEGPFLKKIIFYTVPIIFTGLLQLTFNAADLIIVGQFCGEVSVAAVGATGALTNLIVNLFIGLSVGAGVAVAQSIGAGHDQEVHRTIHTAIPTAILSGLILTVVGVSISEQMLRLMGTPDDVIGLSALYMRIYFGGILGPMVYNFGASILRAAGDTKGPLIYLTCAGVLNVVLNTFFVIVLQMDVAGVALATIISQFLAAGLVLRALMKRTDACKLSLKKLKIYRGPLLKIIRIGLPSGIQGSLFSISNVIIQSSVNSFQSVVMAGSAAAGNLEGFVYVSMNAFHQTAINFTGQNVGRRRYDNVKKIVLICLGCVTCMGLVLGNLVYFFGKPLLSIYISDSAEAIQYGLLRLGLVSAPYFLAGIMDTMTGALRGMGASATPMFISVLGVCGLRIAWIYTVFQMERFHTLECLFLSYPITWLITFTAEFIAFLILLHRQKKRWKHHLQTAQNE